MKINYQEWLKEQTEELKKEIGSDIKAYIRKPCTLEELKKLDEDFITNGPEGGEYEHE